MEPKTSTRMKTGRSSLSLIVNSDVIDLNQSARKLRVCPIQRIEGLTNCLRLKTLDLSLNAISKIEGLDTLLELTSLNLAQNCIRKIEGLKTLQKLRTLDLSDNKVQRISGAELKPLTSLNTFILARNAVDTLDDLKQFASLPALSVLYLEGNPVASTRDFTLYVTFHIPCLKQLDSVLISADQRQSALRKYAKMKVDVYLVRENLISFRKQISELQETRQELVDREVMINAQLQAIDLDFRIAEEEIQKCREEMKDVEHMMACTPTDQVHSKKAMLQEAISSAEILRDEAAQLSKKLQEARDDTHGKELQLETVRNRIRSRNPASHSEDFLHTEEQQILIELKQMRLSVKALERHHSQVLKDMQLTMNSINAIDKEIQSVKSGIVAWERTFDEETAKFLPERHLELQTLIEKLTEKATCLKAKNVELLGQKTEVQNHLSRAESALVELKEKVRGSEIFIETGQSPLRQRTINAGSGELKAWEVLKNLWSFVSDTEIEDLDVTDLPGSLVKWAESFKKELERKEKDQEMQISTLKRMVEAENANLTAEVKEVERETTRVKQESEYWEEKLSESIAEKQALEATLTLVKTQVSNLTVENQKLQDTILSKETAIAQLTHKALVLSNENSDLGSLCEVTQGKVESLEKEIRKLDKGKIESDVMALEKKLETNNALLTKLDLEVAKKSKMCTELMEKCEKSKLEWEDSEAKLGKIKEDLGYFSNLKRIRDESQVLANALQVVGSALELSPSQDDWQSLAAQISIKSKALKEDISKLHRFETDKIAFLSLCEGKIQQIKADRTKLSEDRMAFRKREKSEFAHVEAEKTRLEQVCKTLKDQEQKLQGQVNSAKADLVLVNAKLASAKQGITSRPALCLSEGKAYPRGCKPSEEERNLVVLRSSPDLGFVSPEPKSSRRHGSVLALQRCDTEEDRRSSQTDRTHRPGSILRLTTGQSQCSTCRIDDSPDLVMDSGGVNRLRARRTGSPEKIEEELQSLRLQLASFADTPLPREPTI